MPATPTPLRTASTAASEVVSPPPRPSRPDFRQPGSAPRWRIGVGASIVLVLVLAAVGVGVSGFAGARQSVSSVDVASDSAAVPVPSSPSTAPSGDQGGRPGGAKAGVSSVFVHVLGRVAHPGLYEVAAGSRLIDVVTAAGGMTPEADQSRVNLARSVVDGEQVIIPAAGDEIPASAADPGSGGASGAAPGVGASKGAAVVDLNTADAAALEALPGVGPATAQAILDWRVEHGRFEAVEDLLDVTGIGDKKFDKLRDDLTVS